MKTILVAEDEPHIRRLIQVNLERAGYCVETAENGQQAWERLQQGGIDLLLTDLMMPVMDGFELIVRQREIHSATPLSTIVMQWPLDRRILQAKGIDDVGEFLRVAAVINKPFNPMELLHIVNQYFEVPPPGGG